MLMAWVKSRMRDARRARRGWQIDLSWSSVFLRVFRGRCDAVNMSCEWERRSRPGRSSLESCRGALAILGVESDESSRNR